MSKKTKLQHYVPKFYLRGFSVGEKRDFLCCFDKPKSRSFIVNIKNIASERYFNDTVDDVEQITEKGISRLESRFKAAHRKLTSSEDLSALTSKERLMMAYFVVIQELRTEEHRATLEDMHGQTLAALSKRKMPKELVKQSELTREQIKSWHISQLSDVPDYVDIVSRMKWVILMNITSAPFWSSDHPVNRFNNFDARPYGNLGLLSKGIEIHFPLSPRLSLCVCDPHVFKLISSRYEIEDAEAIGFHNWLQVRYSTRYVFSNNEDFSLAETILKENPSLRNVARRRTSVH